MGPVSANSDSKSKTTRGIRKVTEVYGALGYNSRRIGSTASMFFCKLYVTVVKLVTD